VTMEVFVYIIAPECTLQTRKFEILIIIPPTMLLLTLYSAAEDCDKRITGLSSMKRQTRVPKGKSENPQPESTRNHSKHCGSARGTDDGVIAEK
jgi:hypothetical protein